MPEVDKPRSIRRRMERLGDGQKADISSLQIAGKMRKSDPEYRAELQELASCIAEVED